MVLMILAARMRGGSIPATPIPQSILDKAAALPTNITPTSRLKVRQLLQLLALYPEDKFGQRPDYENRLLHRLQFEFDPFARVVMTAPRAVMLYAKFLNDLVAAQDIVNYYPHD